MAANTQPIYTLSPDVSANGTTGFSTTLLTATGDYSGVSADHSIVFTADSTNGGYIQGIKFKAIGTNVASVVRIYINNGSSAATATNNTFFGEMSLPATTATNTAATAELYFPMNFAINPGFTVRAGVATTVAAGWVATAVGGKY